MVSRWWDPAGTREGQRTLPTRLNAMFWPARRWGEQSARDLGHRNSLRVTTLGWRAHAAGHQWNPSVRGISPQPCVPRTLRAKQWRDPRALGVLNPPAMQGAPHGTPRTSTAASWGSANRGPGPSVPPGASPHPLHPWAPPIIPRPEVPQAPRTPGASPEPPALMHPGAPPAPQASLSLPHACIPRGSRTLCTPVSPTRPQARF